MADVQRNLKGGKAYVMVGNLQVFPDGRRDVRRSFLSRNDLEVTGKGGKANVYRSSRIQLTFNCSNQPSLAN